MANAQGVGQRPVLMASILAVIISASAGLGPCYLAADDPARGTKSAPSAGANPPTPAPRGAVANDWPAWRGAESNGVRVAPIAVLNWSQRQGVRWKVAIPGEGHASPIVAGDRVFVSTADEQAQTRSVLCWHRQTGNLLWNTVLDRGGFMAKHEKNTHASPTPACDGRRLYVPFVAHDALWLHAIDLNGQIVWQRRIGPFAQRAGEAWGYGSSPALYKDLVIVAGDNQGSNDSAALSSYLAAVRADTGQIAWRVPRPLAPSYGTPVVARVAGRDQLLLSGCRRISSFDPASGKELWFCRWSAHRSANSMAWGPDCVYASMNWPERQVLCIRADGAGDVTESHIIWRQARGACDVPSPLYHQGRLYLVNEHGMMSCLDGGNGTVAWQERLGAPFSASPVAVGDRILATDEEGMTHVIEGRSSIKVLAHNPLPEPVLASLALSGNEILVRSQNSLWCLDGKPPVARPAERKIPATQPVVAAAKGARETDWWGFAGFGLLVMTLLLCGVCFVVSHRRGKTNLPLLSSARPLEAEAEQPAAYLFFQCSGCGRKLKYKAPLAGTYVKCPSCRGKSLTPGPDTIQVIEPL